MERMLKELEELKAQAFETRKESDRHDSYYEGINQAVDIVKNCTIHGVTQQSELLIAFFNHLVKITDLRDYYDTNKLVDDFLRSNL